MAGLARLADFCSAAESFTQCEGALLHGSKSAGFDEVVGRFQSAAQSVSSCQRAGAPLDQAETETLWRSCCQIWASGGSLQQGDPRSKACLAVLWVPAMSPCWTSWSKEDV